MKRRQKRSVDRKSDTRLRILGLALLMLVATAVLIRVLYREQVESGEEHRIAVSRQSIRRIRVPARRGRILTSDLRIAAENRPVLNLVFYPEEMRLGRRKKSIRYMLEASRKIADAIGRENPLNYRKIEHHLNWSPGLPLVVFHDLDETEAARALESSRQMRGVDVETGIVRSYPLGDFAPHLIGFTRPESPREAADRREFFYYIPDLIGRGGIEAKCDSPNWAAPGSGLRGTPGYSLIQVDHLGYVHRSMVDKLDPSHGENVVLTLDSRAQKTAERLLDGKLGAMVMLDADTGDILAAATAPRYDLSKFSPSLSGSFFQRLREDPRRPLLNRAFQGTYTPGSILKPLTALAVLESGIPPDEQVNCTGYNAIGDAAIRCAAYRRGGHGPTDLEHALEWSCNSYFITMGLRIGDDALFRILASAGVGRPAGAELPEASGIMPSYQLKRKLYGYRWNRYDTALLSMGQGLVTLTPLQAAVYTAALANGGTLWKPHLVRRLTDGSGVTVWERAVQRTGKLAAAPKNLELVRRGMFLVVNSETGSGRRGAVPGLKVYGKTGSAEVGSKNDRRLITWFIAFAEHRGRNYALAVMVEDGMSGGTDCAPLAAEMFKRCLRPEEKTDVPAI